MILSGNCNGFAGRAVRKKVRSILKKFPGNKEKSWTSVIPIQPFDAAQPITCAVMDILLL